MCFLLDGKSFVKDKPSEDKPPAAPYREAHHGIMCFIAGRGGGCRNICWDVPTNWNILNVLYLKSQSENVGPLAEKPVFIHTPECDHPLTHFADQQSTDESWIDIPDRVNLRRVWVGEALGIAASGTVFRADVPDVLVVSSRIYGIVLLLMTCCGVIISSSWWENTHLNFPSRAAGGKRVSQEYADRSYLVKAISWYFLEKTDPDFSWL